MRVITCPDCKAIAEKSWKHQTMYKIICRPCRKWWGFSTDGSNTLLHSGIFYADSHLDLRAVQQRKAEAHEAACA